MEPFRTWTNQLFQYDFYFPYDGQIYRVDAGSDDYINACIADTQSPYVKVAADMEPTLLLPERFQLAMDVSLLPTLQESMVFALTVGSSDHNSQIAPRIYMDIGPYQKHHLAFWQPALTSEPQRVRVPKDLVSRWSINRGLIDGTVFTDTEVVD